MSTNSTIEWTDSTWNPVTGCTKISDGCTHCYAERMSKRLQAMGNKNYSNGFKVTCHESMVDRPLFWNKPQNIFVNSMSDLFHEEVPFEFISKVFDVMNKAHWHQFQVLTKRSQRLAEISAKLKWTPNIWIGVSVENRKNLYRIDDLRSVNASIRFISFEPLLGDLGLINLKKVDWAIVGGESGPHARKLEQSWVTSIRDQCISAGVPFFFKQWGGVFKKKNGRILEGMTWSQYPKMADQALTLIG